MKGEITVILVIALLVIFAVLMTFNVKLGHSIAISLETESQKHLLIDGRNPDITFISLQDTPYEPNIKILRVTTHHVWGGESDLNDHLVNWLNELGIISYPDFLVKYIGE